MGKVMPFRRRRRRPPDPPLGPWKKARSWRPWPWSLMIALLAVATVAYIRSGYFQVTGAGSGSGSSTEIVGRASVIDGDTLDIRGTRIRLESIDAPEGRQMCLAQGQKYRCGQQAANALSDKIGSRTVSCEPRGEDRYHRTLAVCRAGGVDLNGWLVAQGWALAYRRYSARYIPQENSARASGLGVWQGEFVEPWDWRRGERL